MNLLPVFLVGLMGSVHCLGMCGGIVGALSSAAPAGASRPLLRHRPVMQAGAARLVAVQATAHSRAVTWVQTEGLRVAAYNLGRIGSYMAAGALAGGIASGLLHGAELMGQLASVQRVAYVVTNLILVLLGLYLTQWGTGLSQLERAGARVWALVRPLAMRFFPADTAGKALMLGGLWGWLPCGMVYSVLITAMLSGSATNGALTMLAFGTGTLPMLLAAGLSGAKLRQMAAQPAWRRVGGIVVLMFGVLGLLRAAEVGGFGIAHGLLDVLCIGTPHIGGAQP